MAVVGKRSCNCPECVSCLEYVERLERVARKVCFEYYNTRETHAEAIGELEDLIDMWHGKQQRQASVE